MPMLELKPSSKQIGEYYATLAEFNRLGVSHEMAVRSAFQRLLEFGCKKAGWTFIPEFKYKRPKRNPASVDGGMVDTFSIPRAWWEAKDTKDDLLKEARKKINDDGYPDDNIIFQSPTQALVYQDGRKVLDEDISKPAALIYTLQALFDYRAETQQDWERAVEDFKPKIPDAARALVTIIEEERLKNQRFVTAFNGFATLCRAAVNPNLADLAVEEMLVQHLLTERIFRKVFHNSEFAERNVIAHEIEQVIMALTSRKFSREEFFKPLDRFYIALERRADTLDDYDQKQTFLNTVYEKFFQGFAVKVADTHGIVYTPQPIVSFIVRSVEEILKKEFGKSLSDKGVHILDPFVGTGNFIVRVMREIKKTALKHKFQHELHCNEVLLLPYYVAAMNIEHEYYEHTGEYLPFDGICLVDTFELAEEKQTQLFTAQNTDRVNQLKKTPLFVILGNPPYNAGQVNENDNNKNRKYETMDKRVKETYSKDSKATLRAQLGDPYVKAIRWASDKIRENGEGVVAFVTNNSFIDAIAFDGMRKHLEQDFDQVYILDLGGNVRKNPKLSGTTHNVFGIQVGVSINLFVKKKKQPAKAKGLFYARMDEFWRKEQKLAFLDTSESYSKIKWEEVKPDAKHNWLMEGL
ncbi:MAG: N-6 DNA methylase, partial [Nitrospinae bacterium]|nr:N-6 DNA methylase [Nitrospinota bacterium]